MAARIMAVVFAIIGLICLLPFAVLLLAAIAEGRLSDALDDYEMIACGVMGFWCIVIACFFGAMASIHSELVSMRKSMTRAEIHNRINPA